MTWKKALLALVLTLLVTACGGAAGTDPDLDDLTNDEQTSVSN